MTLLLSESPEGTDLVVTGRWSQQAADCLRDGAATGLVLNYARGFSESDLSFLSGLPVRRLSILHWDLRDLRPVYSLRETLVSLSAMTHPSAVLDLAQFPLLQELSTSWFQVRDAIQSAAELRRLFLLSYTENDLVPLAGLHRLETLVMKDYPRVQTLDGVETLRSLRELGIHIARRLKSIDALQGSLAQTMETLQLSSCRRLESLAPIRSCQGLQFLEFSEGGDLPDISALEGLDQIESLYLYGSTRVVDGDLTPIAELPRLHDFRMQGRRHYKPSVAEIQRAIGERTRDTAE